MMTSRRGFLGLALAGGAFAELRERFTLRADTPLTPVAVIGCGQRGAAHAAFWAGGGALAALHDALPGRAEALGARLGVPAIHDLGRILDDPRVPAVVIATPDASHAQITRAALAAGKEICLELPAVGPGDDLAALAALDTELHVSLCIESPLAADLCFAREVFDYGAVRHAQFHVRPAAGEALAWQCDPARSFGPAAMQVYAQALAFHLLWMDAALPCEAVLQHNGTPRRVPDHLVLTLAYADGRRAVFQAGPRATGPDVVHFEHAACEISDGRYRYTDARGAAFGSAADRFHHGAFSSTRHLWQHAMAARVPALFPLADARPVHAAFARALA